MTTIDTSVSPFFSTDMTNDLYHSIKTHKSRSEVRRYSGVYGGRAQRYAEVAKQSLFAGNAATSFGSLVDIAFEATVRGEDWRQRVAVAPPGVLASDGSRRGKPFTEWRSSLAADVVECNAGDFLKAGEIIGSLLEHQTARSMIDAITHPQYSAFWRDEAGHDRKARGDGVTKDTWFDLKTTSSDWHGIGRSFRQYGYDWQAAWYMDAAAALGWPPFRFDFICVQTSPPYDVCVFWLSDDNLERARHEIRQTLDDVRRRTETGDYVDPMYHEPRELDIY